MRPEELRQIVLRAVEDAQQDQLWIYFAMILVAGAASFIGSYLRRKGENLATKEDFNEIKRQLGETTELTEKIKSEILAETTRTTEAIKAQIAAGAEFGKQVITDRYKLARDIHAKLQTITTNLNRSRHGQDVPGLFVGDELLPLTEVYEGLNANRYLLNGELYDILLEYANHALFMANVRANEKLWDEASQRAHHINASLANAMNASFDLARWAKVPGE